MRVGTRHGVLKMRTGMFFIVAASAITVQASAGIFDSYNVGSIDGQNGWTCRDNFTTSVTVGNWDQAIKQVNDANGNRKVWQISNAKQSTTYSSMPFSFTSAQVAGETGAALWNNRGTNGSSPTSPQFGAYATTNSFYSSVSFRSATGGPQAGLGMTFSLGSKQATVRMSYVRIEDNGSTGINVIYLALNSAGQSVGTTTLATLNYTDLHTIEMGAVFNDGLNNDFFGVRINGGALFAGTTWEAYYSANELTTPGTPRLQAVNSLLCRVNNSTSGGTTSLTGNGFFIEDMTVNNSAIPAPGALALLGAAGMLGGRRRR